MINVMFVDLKVFTDARVKRLAERHHWSRRETLGTLLEVWSLIYVRNSPVIADADIDELANIEGFAASLVSVAQLARRVDSGIHLRGADSALELRARLTRENEARQTPKNSDSSNARARTRTPARTRTRSSSSEGVLDVSVSSEHEKTDQKLRRGERVELRAITDAFAFNFREHNSGRAPTWRKGDLRNLLSIVKQHGAVEVLDRMRRMFTDAPPWIHPPYTLATLVQHFDHFVPVVVKASKSKHGRFEPKPDTDYSKTPWEVSRERR